MSDYLETVRAIDQEKAERYGVTMRRLKLGEAVAIAYRKDGEVYGHKVRPLDPGDGPRFFFHPTGAKRDLWNVDVLRDDTLFEQPIVITEGELDALSCIQAGFVRAVSIPDGWTNKFIGDDGPKSRPVLGNIDALRRSPFVIIAGDGDDTGASFVRAVANMLDGHPCKFLDYPPDCKDANDILRKYGSAELVRVLNAARWCDPEGGLITGFSDLPPIPDMQIFRPDYDPFDKVILFHTGYPTIVTGIPSHGKSTFLTCALHHVVRTNGIRVAIAGLETPPDVLRDHLARLNGGKPWANHSAAERASLEARLDRNYRVLHKIDTERGLHDIGWIRDMMRAAVVRDGCKIVAFDPWNEIDHTPERGESMTAYVNVAISRIRQWAERFDCAVAIVAHPTKMQSIPGAKPHAPGGYDISDSSAWYNKAAIGVTVHMVEGDDPHVQVINWKSKFVQQYGIAKGKIDLDFDERAMAYRRRP